MRISICLGPFLSVPPAPAGALERLWDDIAAAFASRGHEVEVLCRYSEELRGRSSRNGVAYRYCTGFGQSRHLWVNILRDLAYSLRLARQIRSCDIAIVNSFWLPILAPILRRRAKRVVYNVARMPKAHFRCYGRLDALFAVSSAARAAVCRVAPALSSKTLVVNNPIDTRAFFPRVTGRCLPESGEIVILYTGRIHREKGINVLVQGFRTLYERNRRLRLRVIGPHTFERGGSGAEYLSSLRQLASGLPVEFCAPIWDRAQLRMEMCRAHLYCYPSLAERGETFGVAPLEAMATGLPAIVSDLDCFKDFVTDGQTGLIFSHRAAEPQAALAACIQRLLDDPALYATMSTKAAACAMGFSNEAIAEQYLRAFHRLLEAKPA